MDPNEVEFFGEKQLVSIVPNFNSDVIYLISGSVGPFRAGLPVKVPIWLAVYLKQKQKCRIVSQEWMDIESLNERKEMEKMSKLFTEMPSYHYMDESQILLSVANDDIPDADGIRIAVKDIWDIRMSKLRTSVDAFVKSEGVHARLDHLTAMEINGIRPLLPHALDQMLRIQSANTGETSSQYSSGNIWDPEIAVSESIMKYLGSFNRALRVTAFVGSSKTISSGRGAAQQEKRSNDFGSGRGHLLRSVPTLPLPAGRALWPAFYFSETVPGAPTKFHESYGREEKLESCRHRHRR